MRQLTPGHLLQLALHYMLKDNQFDSINFKNIYLILIILFTEFLAELSILRFLLLRNLRFMLSLFQSQKLRFEFSRLWWNFRYCQVRPVVPVHRFGPGAHGQEAGSEHFQIRGPGHARGHGWGSARGGKAGSVGWLLDQDESVPGNRPHSSGGAG